MHIHARNVRDSWPDLNIRPSNFPVLKCGAGEAINWTFLGFPDFISWRSLMSLNDTGCTCKVFSVR